MRKLRSWSKCTRGVGFLSEHHLGSLSRAQELAQTWPPSCMRRDTLISSTLVIGEWTRKEEPYLKYLDGQEGVQWQVREKQQPFHFHIPTAESPRSCFLLTIVHQLFLLWKQEHWFVWRKGEERGIGTMLQHRGSSKWQQDTCPLFNKYQYQLSGGEEKGAYLTAWGHSHRGTFHRRSFGKLVFSSL